MSANREFVIMLKPPRPNFNETSTERENAVIAEHFEYLKHQLSKGILKLAGRCDDATFGLVILETDSLETATQIMHDDPAVKAGVFSAQIWPYCTALRQE